MDYDAIRTLVRQWCIQYISFKLPDDLNDWTLEHPHAITSTQWLVSWLKSGALHITLNDLLEFDHLYPGVLKDADTFIWQLELTKGQAESEK